MNRRNVLILATILLLLVTTVGVIAVARGYQLDLKTATLAPTGILVTTSDPDGAEVFVNGKLTTATNNTINLPPGKYSVKIAKEGFTSWEKTVEIKNEEVFKTNAFLFPNLPELRPITLSGAKNPSFSPDGTKIAYAVASASGQRNGIWILDMSRTVLPAGIFASSDLRQIYQTTPNLPLLASKFIWSPDDKQLVASTSARLYYQLNPDQLNDAPELLSSQLDQTLAQWAQLTQARYGAQLVKIPPVLAATLATSAGTLTFSPDETKILYQATASALLPKIMTTYLPGTNPTPETRLIKAQSTYVYDLKEDRNYEIAVNPVVWFPTSRHLLSYTDKEISVMEFDGTNRAIIYAGPFSPGVVYPWPDSHKIVILTSLNGPAAGVDGNLYTINLR